MLYCTDSATKAVREGGIGGAGLMRGVGQSKDGDLQGQLQLIFQKFRLLFAQQQETSNGQSNPANQNPLS